MAPTTIKEMLDFMQLYVDEGRPIEASDMSHDDKIAALTVLSQKYGLYE